MLPQRLVAQLSRAQRLLRNAHNRVSPARRRQRARFAEMRDRFYEDFWRRTAERCGARFESLDHGYFRIRRQRRWTIVREADVMLDDHLSLDLAGDKPIFNRLLAEHGFPAVRHERFTLASLDTAQRFLEQLDGRPAVVKPAFGTGAGRGVTMGVLDGDDLRRAALRAAEYRPRLLIEEQISGHNYRLLYLDGQLLDAIRRDPPAVQGDGRSTIGTLIEQENARRLDGSPVVSLHPIDIDRELRVTLRGQGRSLKSVPQAGEQVVVKSVINQNAAEQNVSVLAEVHPELERVGAHIMAVFGFKLIGLDLISAGVDVPLAESGGIINELNTTPGLHHHVLVADPARAANIGEPLLELLLEGPTARRDPVTAEAK